MHDGSGDTRETRSDSRAEQRGPSLALGSSVADATSTEGPLIGRFFPIFTDFSDLLGRLQPSKTAIQTTPNALGVEESSYPLRVPLFNVAIPLEVE